MIKTEVLAPNVLKIVAPQRLNADDFRDVAPMVDSIIERHGKIRLLIDGTRLEGWKDIAAFETHAKFVKDHQAKVERIAVIAPHEWQQWLVGAVRVFVHPEVKAFGAGGEGEASRWLVA
jgi:SpoIIAA-like